MRAPGACARVGVCACVRLVRAHVWGLRMRAPGVCAQGWVSAHACWRMRVLPRARAHEATRTCARVVCGCLRAWECDRGRRFYLIPYWGPCQGQTGGKGEERRQVWKGMCHTVAAHDSMTAGRKSRTVYQDKLVNLARPPNASSENTHPACGYILTANFQDTFENLNPTYSSRKR